MMSSNYIVCDGTLRIAYEVWSWRAIPAMFVYSQDSRKAWYLHKPRYTSCFKSKYELEMLEVRRKIKNLLMTRYTNRRQYTESYPLNMAIGFVRVCQRLQLSFLNLCF